MRTLGSGDPFGRLLRLLDAKIFFRKSKSPKLKRALATRRRSKNAEQKSRASAARHGLLERFNGAPPARSKIQNSLLRGAARN